MPDIDLTVPFHSRFWVEASTPEEECGIGELDPRCDGPPMHGHRDQDEEFEILSGELVFTAAKKTSLARSGDVVRVPRGTAHTYKNLGDLVCRFRYRLTPGNRFHEMMRTFAALVAQGKLRSTSDVRSLVHMSMVFGEFRDHVYGVAPPQAAMNAIGAIGKLFGASITEAVSAAKREPSRL